MTRREAIARIQEHRLIHKNKEPRAIHISEALDMAIEALEQDPNDKYIKEIDHLHKYIAKLETRIVEQDSVLDDVSAEIEEIETYDGIYIDRAYVLQIINKYKAESEDN